MKCTYRVSVSMIGLKLLVYPEADMAKLYALGYMHVSLCQLMQIIIHIVNICRQQLLFIISWINELPLYIEQHRDIFDLTR